MNLDEQLRAALNVEADLQDAPTPDVGRLISRGTGRRRRRNLAQVGVAAAVVAVLVGVGAFVVMQFDARDAAEPAQPAPTTTTTPQTYNSEDQIQTGTYRMLIGVDDAGVAIHADLTFGSEAWGRGNFPVLEDAPRYGGIGIYRPDALAAGTGCASEEPNTQVAETPQALAEQLAQLPRSSVTQPPTSVQAFGGDAVHLQVRIDNDCGDDDGYRIAETVRGSHDISFGETTTGAVVDFWVVDINAVGVVVAAWHDGDASRDVVDEVARTSGSIVFVTEE
jgi:hypothetical protein